MSAIHVLGGNGSSFRVVVHINAPAGNNAAGTAWADAIKNSGRAKTVMTVGAGAGQITQAEADQIAAGTVVEGAFIWGDDPTWTNAQRQADVDLRATQLAAELLARIQADLKYFGYTR